MIKIKINNYTFFLKDIYQIIFSHKILRLNIDNYTKIDILRFNFINYEFTGRRRD